MKIAIILLATFFSISSYGQSYPILDKNGDTHLSKVFTSGDSANISLIPSIISDTSKQNRLPYWKKWVIFGDSFSATGVRYSARVDSLLALTGTTTFGVSGHTYALQSAKVDSIIAATPTYFAGFNIASILLGINDFAGSAVLGTRGDAAGTASVAGYLKNMIEKILTSNKSIFLYVITPPEANGAGVTYHGTNVATIPWNLNSLSILISQICHDYGVNCIDLHTTIPFNLITLPTLTSDGLHPNYLGSILLSGAISQAFISQNNFGVMVDTTYLRTFTKYGLGDVTPTTTTADIITIQTLSPAALGAQQIPGAIHFIGRGWGTTAGTSQTTDWWDWVLPYQGTVPTSERRWTSGLNNNSLVNAMVLSSAGALSINSSLTVGNSSLGSGITSSRPGLAASQGAGIVITNPTAATSGVPVQLAPSIQLNGAAWDGSASRIANFRVNVVPVNGTSPITSYITIGSQINAGGYVEQLRIGSNGKITQPTTVTAGGTTGNQTINKPTGTVNIAAAGTTITVTNSLCTTSSIVFSVIRTNDTTAKIKNVVPGSGSFVINMDGGVTTETSIGFWIIN